VVARDREPPDHTLGRLGHEHGDVRVAPDAPDVPALVPAAAVVREPEPVLGRDRPAQSDERVRVAGDSRPYEQPVAHPTTIP
jgi:hypothetical protein